MFKNKANKTDKAAKQPVFKQDYFKNCHRTYSCIHCRAHLANHDELISKLFQGNHGRAYLFNKVVNVGCRQAVQRELLTGLHAVADIYCDSCETTLGWKYEQAFVPSQKYKEGKYIIELVHMLKENDWDLNSYNARDLLKEAKLSSGMEQLDNNRMANSFKIGDSCYWLGTSETSESKDKNHINRSRCEMPSNLGIVVEDENVELGAQEIAEPLTTSHEVNKGDGETFEMKELATKQIPPNYIEGQDGADENEVVDKDSENRSEQRSGRVEIEVVSNESIELADRSLNFQLSLANNAVADKSLPQNLSVKDSYCSSHSQSDLSSYATDSSATDESTCEPNPSPQRLVVHDGIINNI